MMMPRFIDDSFISTNSPGGFAPHDWLDALRCESAAATLVPQRRANCPLVCQCWPDGCLCYYDCTGGRAMVMQF